MANHNSSEFFRARAAQSASEADATTLDNVRDRNRRSETAWLAMADQAEANETERAASAAEKASKAANGDSSEVE